MKKEISGGCYCGAIQFTLQDDFTNFYFCHCEQCRKMVGTAHAANLFTSPININWVKGKDLVKRYDDPNRSFTQAFCPECGSSLPYINKNGKSLIVPAGSLNEEPTKQVDAEIFCAEQPNWYKGGLKTKKYEGFPQ